MKGFTKGKGKGKKFIPITRRKSALTKADCVSRKIPKLRHEGKPQKQSIAIAESMCRKKESLDDPDEIKKELDSVLNGTYGWSGTPELKDVDGEPLETIYYNTIGSMGSPYLHRYQRGFPRVEKDWWYLFDADSGIVGIKKKKSDYLGDQVWHRVADGYYEDDNGFRTMIRGDKIEQEDLDKEVEQNVSNDYRETPFQKQLAVCKNCGNFRSGFGGDNGVCDNCKHAQNKHANDYDGQGDGSIVDWELNDKGERIHR